MNHLINHETGCQARVAVRVSPEFELQSSGIKMGGGSKQFGVDAEQVPELLEGIARSGLAFEGFHLFAGSQNLRPESIVEAQCKSYKLALRLAQSAHAPIRFLNFGSGFGIPNFPGDQYLDSGVYRCQPGEHGGTCVARIARSQTGDRIRTPSHTPSRRLRHAHHRPQGQDKVKVRIISGGTRSNLGRQCRDTLASPKIAFRKLGVSFSAYLPHRITNAGKVPPLADLMRQLAA